MFYPCSKSYTVFLDHWMMLSLVCFEDGCKSVFRSGFQKHPESVLNFAWDYIACFFPVAEENAWAEQLCLHK